MENLKKQQEKLLTLEITRKTMEYMMGLNEKNEPRMRKKIKKFSRQVVKFYTATIDKQHKKAGKAKEHVQPVEIKEQIDITGEQIIITSVPGAYTEAIAS